MNDTYDLFELDALNPLLRHLPRERSLVEWARALKHDPRRRWKRPYPYPAPSHAHAVGSMFVPTAVAVQAVLSVFTMMVVSLRQRDPNIAQNRRALFEFGEWRRAPLGKDLKEMPWFPSNAAGSIWRGPTGCAKTFTAEGLFRLIPQVIDHGEEPDSGWISLRQLLYLRVGMPSDVSRAGLLLAIAESADHVLGTRYAVEVLKRRTIEEKLVEVLHLLIIHRCGLLVLDEVQDRNVKPVVLGSEFATFFLRLLNCGIPLLLIGNPMSFDYLLTFSQDLRRLCANGMFDFGPAASPADEEWTEQLVPGIWNWTLFNEKDEFVADLAKLLFERTGGIHDVLVKYRRECLIQAIEAGAPHVTRKHMDAAWRSPVMRGFKVLAEAYARRDVKTLAKAFVDQPISYLETYWKEANQEREEQKPAEAVAA